MTHPAGFLAPATVRAYRAAHRHATTVTQRRVLDDLEACERKHGRASPSVIGIAERARCSTRSVIRATRALEDAGRLRIVSDTPRRRPDGTYFRPRTNLYRITFPPRNPWSHRRDTAGTSIRFAAIRTGPTVPGASTYPQSGGNAGRMTNGPNVPDHADRRTWLACMESGCSERVDPWDHNTRCPAHRPDPDAPILPIRHV